MLKVTFRRPFFKAYFVMFRKKFLFDFPVYTFPAVSTLVTRKFWELMLFFFKYQNIINLLYLTCFISGKGGSKIREIQAETGARLKV